MRQKSRMAATLLSTLAVGGMTGIVWTALNHPSAAQVPQQTPPAPVAATTGQPSVFRQYCVGCHNERMKAGFGDLSLENVDPADVAGHGETLEKVVRKLRKGQMPPTGRPRPDAAGLEAFTASIESRARCARRDATEPGTRRVTTVESRRIRQRGLRPDRLEVNGSELLPSDMAGFGFDNNADVLSITPGLMARYITAATKISRVALATPDNRPASTRYKVEIGTRQDSRMGDEMPFAAFGGLTVKHTFPLDGEYGFQLRLTRDQDGLINGIMAEHVIELRVDRALVKRFTIGGKYKEPDPGQLIAVPEDDVLGAEVHKHYISADDELTVRVPVKAGTRTVTAAFVENEPIPGPPMGRGVTNIIGGGGGAALDLMSVSGPFNPGETEETPTRQRILICKPAAARDEEPCARNPRQPDAARVSRLRQPGRRRPTPGHLQARPRRARLRYGYRARARSAVVVAQVRVAAGTGTHDAAIARVPTE